MKEVASKECMNLKVGGIGGFPPSAKKRFLEKMKDFDFKKAFGKKASERNKKLYETGVLKKGLFYDWNGKKHKPETIEKMKQVKKDKGIGETNSQYGSFWITNGSENKKTKSEIPEGWYRGRVL
jgi:hypothetical protein